MKSTSLVSDIVNHVWYILEMFDLLSEQIKRLDWSLWLRILWKRLTVHIRFVIKYHTVVDLLFVYQNYL